LLSGRIRVGTTPLLSVRGSFNPRCALFSAPRVEGGLVVLARDPIDLGRGIESSVSNVVALLTDGLSVRRLRPLAAFMGVSAIEPPGWF